MKMVPGGRVLRRDAIRDAGRRRSSREVAGAGEGDGSALARGRSGGDGRWRSGRRWLRSQPAMRRCSGGGGWRGGRSPAQAAFAAGDAAGDAGRAGLGLAGRPALPKARACRCSKDRDPFSFCRAWPGARKCNRAARSGASPISDRYRKRRNRRGPAGCGNRRSRSPHKFSGRDPPCRISARDKCHSRRPDLPAGSRCPIWKFGISVKPVHEKANVPKIPRKRAVTPFICGPSPPPLPADLETSACSRCDRVRKASGRNEMRK